MAWIEYHTTLRDHWKIKRLAEILGVEYPYALGVVSCLWLWVADYAPNGDINRFSDAEICDAARYNGKKMTKQDLKSAELIDEKGFINDWREHGLRLLKSSRKRQKEYRKRLRNANVTVTPSIPSILSNLSNNNIPPQEIYDYYAKTIKPGAKEDAIKNIAKLLKTGFTKEDLLGRIDAYRQQLNKDKTDIRYYIQANNFFGKAARYKDFEPIKKVEYKPADPNCKVCKGQGKYLIAATSEVKICECRLTH
jgi:hypothetical protein